MEAILEKTRKSIDAVAYLGDGWDDIHKLMPIYPSIPLYAVAGNCDYGSGQNALPFNFASRKIIITHGHRFNVKFGYLRISLWAEENEADVCLFGHTHIPDVFYSGRTLMMNPGSISFPNAEYPISYGVVNISENGVVEGCVMGKRGLVYKRIC
jgi:putative phosphoesterase